MDLGSSSQAAISADGLDKVADASIEVFESVRRCPKPVVARINGPAMGGGFGLLFACDVRVSVNSAFFWWSEVKRGHQAGERVG